MQLNDSPADGAGEAHTEIANSSNVTMFGAKSENNYVVTVARTLCFSLLLFLTIARMPSFSW